MALYGAFSKENHLSELASFINVRGNILTPDLRRRDTFRNLLGDSALTFSSGFISYVLSSSASSGDLRPYNIQTTYSGSGATGGRARFGLTISGTMGGWSNAIKGHVDYGAAGKTTGLGSAIVAELELSAGTTDGTYAPLEIELGIASGGKTGTLTSLIHMNVYGADASEFDDEGYIFNIQGVTPADNKAVKTYIEPFSSSVYGSLKTRIGAVDYFVPFWDSDDYIPLLQQASNGVVGMNVTSAASSGDLRPFSCSTTYTGSGATGGRARFALAINGATMAGWSNALKAQVDYDATGKTSGLGSAFVAEMSMSAGTVDGTYAPLELELNLPSGASLGTQTSMMYLSAQGADIATFDSGGFLMSIQGHSAGTTTLFDTFTQLTNPAIQASLRIKVGATTYYIPLGDTPEFT